MQFHNLTVAQITRETEDARSYALLVPDALQQSFVYRAGQHLTFRVNVDGNILLRSYSLSSSPEAGAINKGLLQCIGDQERIGTGVFGLPSDLRDSQIVELHQCLLASADPVPDP